MTDGIPLDLADRLLAARWDHTSAVTRDAVRTLVDDVRAAGMCGARCTRSGGLSTLEHRICIEPTLHLGYHQDTAATFWPQDAAELEATGRRLSGELDQARAELEIRTAERDSAIVANHGIGRERDAAREENAELRRTLERVRAGDDPTDEEISADEDLDPQPCMVCFAGGIADAALARTGPARADR